MEDATKIEIVLDGENLAFDASASFGAVAEQIKSSLAPHRVVTEIFVDGRSVNMEEEEMMILQSMKDLGQLTFKSREVGLLLKDSLQLAPQICEALLMDCDDIGGMIEKSEFLKANDRIAELSSLVDWLLQMVASIHSYGDDTSRMFEYEGQSLTDTVKRMESSLTKLHTQLQNKDYMAFKSVLQGEFRVELGAWQKMFTEVAKNWTPRILVRAS